MSQHPPESSGSHPDQPPQQEPASPRPDEAGAVTDPATQDRQEAPHQPYDQQVPHGYTEPYPGSDPYRQVSSGAGQQGHASPGYPPSGPQGYAEPQGYASGAQDAWRWGPGQPSHGPQGYRQQGQESSSAPPGRTRPPAPPLSARDETLWAVLAHLSIPFTGFVGPLAVYVAFRGRSPWLRQSAVEALNFSLVYTGAQVVCSLLVAMVVGAVLMPLVLLAGLALCILAALAAGRHEPYRYPVAARVVS